MHIFFQVLKKESKHPFYLNVDIECHSFFFPRSERVPSDKHFKIMLPDPAPLEMWRLEAERDGESCRVSVSCPPAREITRAHSTLSLQFCTTEMSLHLEDIHRLFIP